MDSSGLAPSAGAHALHSLRSHRSHGTHGHRSSRSRRSRSSHNLTRTRRSHAGHSSHGSGARVSSRRSQRSHRSQRQRGLRVHAEDGSAPLVASMSLPASPVSLSRTSRGDSTSGGGGGRTVSSRLRLSKSAMGRSRVRPSESTRSLPLETGLRNELDSTGVHRSQLIPQAHVLGYTGHQPGLLGLGQVRGQCICTAALQCCHLCASFDAPAPLTYELMRAPYHQQEVFTETAPVLERMLSSMSTNLTYGLHPVPMARGSVSWMSTTAHDVARDGIVPLRHTRTLPAHEAREHFRNSSEFSRYVDECIRRHLDPLGTGH